MKSRRVLLGQPVTVCSTLSYRECMLLWLWLLTRVDSCCDGFGCCGSLTEELLRADWSSCFKLAVSLLTTMSLFFSIFQHHQVGQLFGIIRCLRTLSPFPPTTVQGVSFLFLILKGVCKFFRGLSVSCHTASGVLSCYTWNHCPGLQCFVGACLVSMGSRQFLIRTDTGPTTAFANKSAMKLVVAARTNSIFQVSLRHYDL